MSKRRKVIGKSNDCNKAFTQKGTWCSGVWCSKIDGDKQFVSLKCPICGQIIALSKEHEIEPNGDVNPSVKCWDCRFDRYIKLDDFRLLEGGMQWAAIS